LLSGNSLWTALDKLGQISRIESHGSHLSFTLAYLLGQALGGGHRIVGVDQQRRAGEVALKGVKGVVFTALDGGIAITRAWAMVPAGFCPRLQGR
jgi:hypothetical protein